MTLSTLPRRGCIAALVACAATAVLPAFAQAQDWPAKPVKFINNFPPGGPSDLIARSVAKEMEVALKQPVIVENRAGASGNIGADAVVRSPADGYTVLFGIDTTFTVNPHIYHGMPFTPADLKPVMVIASSGLLIGVNPRTGIKTLQQLVAAGKRKPVTFSSAGSGSPGHLAASMLIASTGMKVTHVPYKGNTPAVRAVLAGEVDAGELATPGMLPHVKAGKITALAVTSRTRSKLAPEIPTVAEAGLPQLQQEVLYLAMVPAATPEPVVAKLRQALADALARPEVRQRMDNLDLHYEGLTGAAASGRLAELSGHYGQVIRTTGMKVE